MNVTSGRYPDEEGTETHHHEPKSVVVESGRCPDEEGTETRPEAAHPTATVWPM